MKSAMQKRLEAKRAAENPTQQELYKKIYKEIIDILAKNKCTASEALNILKNLRQGIGAAETVHELGINEYVTRLCQ